MFVEAIFIELVVTFAQHFAVVGHIDDEAIIQQPLGPQLVHNPPEHTVYPRTIGPITQDHLLPLLFRGLAPEGAIHLLPALAGIMRRLDHLQRRLLRHRHVGKVVKIFVARRDIVAGMRFQKGQIKEQRAFLVHAFVEKFQAMIKRPAIPVVSFRQLTGLANVTLRVFFAGAVFFGFVVIALQCRRIVFAHLHGACFRVG